MRLPTLFVSSCLLWISELGLTLGREATVTVAEMEVDDDGATVSTTAGAKPAVSLNTDAELSPLEETDDVTAFFSKVSTRIHHNGNPNPCGVAPPSLQVFSEAINDLEATKEVLSSDKFAMEAFLTRFFAIQLSRNTSPDTCQPTDSKEDPLHPGLPGFCDMGPQRTVIQHDFDKLVQVPVSKSLPCRFFTREGLRITSLDVLKQVVLRQQQKSGTANVVDLYAVPAGRMFMFGPSHVGEIFELSHVQDTLGRDLVLQTLSLEPRVFDIYHFFSHKESDELVAKALRETSESHRFHRSTTGTTEANVFNKRTSENAWDTHGKTAQEVKKRCFSLLGIDEYVEEMSDGLQILRYNLTTAYTPHMDYLEDRSGKEPYDYDTAGKGGNRFATILVSAFGFVVLLMLLLLLLLYPYFFWRQSLDSVLSCLSLLWNAFQSDLTVLYTHHLLHFVPPMHMIASCTLPIFRKARAVRQSLPEHGLQAFQRKKEYPLIKRLSSSGMREKLTCWNQGLGKKKWQPSVERDW